MHEVHAIADVLRELFAQYDNQGLVSPQPEPHVSPVKRPDLGRRLPVAPPPLVMPDPMETAAMNTGW